MKTSRIGYAVGDGLFALYEYLYEKWWCWRISKIPEPPRVERPPYDGPPVFRERDDVRRV